MIFIMFTLLKIPLNISCCVFFFHEENETKKKWRKKSVRVYNVHQGGYTIAGTYLSFYLFLSKLTQNLINKFSEIFRKR